MSSRQDWGATLLSNSGAATGAWTPCPGGKIAFTFSGIVTDVDVEFRDINDANIPISSALTTVAAAGIVTADLPPGFIRATVVTGTAVYVRAATVPV
jgi:hypothetical protein